MIRINIAGTDSNHSGENLTEPINNCMLISEITINDWKASKKVCKSSKPDKELGASTLSSCKSQGLRARDGEKSYTIGGKKTKIAGKKIKGGKYAGPLPVHGKKNKQNAKKSD